ncbi:MAG: NAD-dependent malic enzyme [Phototrophicaceae bacterium]
MINIQDHYGISILHDPNLNKGTAFTTKEREVLGLNGLLPAHVSTMEEQVERVMLSLRAKTTDLEKHIYLISLQERNRTLFYRIVIDYLEEILPLIYTPTVGQACQEYAHIFRRSQGLYITQNDEGNILNVLNNWADKDIRVIVVTDGERILGLGDLGANGMGIPVGKLSIYTACAGIHPRNTLPVTIDVGTNNADYLRDPLYLGLRQPRIADEVYDALIAEFVEAVKIAFPQALLQFEDFGNKNAFPILKKYRYELPSFNDDIQGTAVVALAGILSALRLSKQKLSEQKFLFLGAGEAGIGIGQLFVNALVEAGMNKEDAKKRCWFFDSKGLVVASRDNLQAHKLQFAHEGDFISDLGDAVDYLQPTALIGVSGQGRAFTQSIIEKMADINERPIIFALSNPTSKSECTAEEAYTWTQGRAIFASGSPFPSVTYNEQFFVPGQANNAYIFPGIGLGVVVSGATQVTDNMFLMAAKKLAELVDESDLEQGRVFPSLKTIREISAQIAVEIVKIAHEDGVAQEPLAENLLDFIRLQMYEPVYQDYA